LKILVVDILKISTTNINYKIQFPSIPYNKRYKLSTSQKTKILKNMKLKFFVPIFSFFLSSFIFLAEMPEAKADFNSLTPCGESTAFKKRLNSSVKKLENRLKLYTPESPEAAALVNEIASTKARFERYGSSNLLCGKEGLPRIIASGQWDHANEFIIPGILFIYITGWIGWVGRKYLRYAATTENSFENEIIINVPIAFSIMNSGFLWPLEAWKEFVSGDLLAAEDDVTVSPR
jgi:photosystem I subunit 3